MGPLRILSEYEIIVSNGTVQKGLLAKCYEILNATDGRNDKFRAQREKEFQAQTDALQWLRSYNQAIIDSYKINIKVNVYHYYGKWYYT